MPTTYTPSQMAAAIRRLSGGGSGNILSGTTEPIASQGDNGTVYLKYYELSLPSGYTELENIQSTGTQYIDTGVNATSDIAVEIDFKDADLGGGDPVLYGMRLSWSQMLGINNGGNQSDTNIMYLYYGENGNAGLISEMMSAVIKLENGKRTVNGVETSFTQTSFSYNYPIFIFAANSSGSPSNYSKYKLNNLKIWDAGTLIRNFVPAKRDSDDTIGLYDTINSTFYTNAGSGSFSAGLEREQGIITDSKLKVSGAWQNLIGSNIDDVETEGGGGETDIIDGGSYEVQQFDFVGAYPVKAGNITEANQNDEALTTCSTCMSYDLGAVNSDVTCYAVIKCMSYGYPQRILSIRYGGSTDNEPMYFVLSSGNIGYTTFNNDKVLSNDYVYDKHVYAISLNNTEKKARFYLDGVFIEELQFNNSGRYVSMCGNEAGMIARSNLYFAGCVHGLQTDQEVIANSLALKAHYSIGA